MTTSKHYDVIFAGNYTKDTIITPGGVRHVDGGAVNYAAHAAACLGVRAAVVTRLAREDQRMITALEAAGVDCYPQYTPSSTLMTLEYKTDDVDKRSLYVTDTAGTVTPSQLDGLEARAVVVGTSLRGEVGLDFFEAVRRQDHVTLAADVQGFVRVLRDRTLVYEPWGEMAAVLQHVDILKSDMVEAEFLTGETDIEKAARFYANLGPKEIVLTHRDGVLIHAGGRDYAYTFHSASMDGRSGRGDTCLGSYVVSRFTLPPAEAGKQAAAVTSLKVERPGPFNRSMEDVQAFIQKHYGG